MVGQVVLDHYQVVRFLDQGSWGKVYLARRTDNGQEVVLKIMHEHMARDPQYRARFRQEMEFMARFRHPYAVNLYEALPKSPLGPCIVMEYVNGQPLDQMLKQQRRFDPARVGRWLGQLCNALQHAHGLDIIHRDLKPNNLMIANPGTPDEKIKVMDFGLSKVGSSQRPTSGGVATGTEQRATGTSEYLSPEQASGEPVEPRSDIYSVGVVLFELLTGKRPFLCLTPKDYQQAHAFRLPPTFAQMGVRDVPPAIEAVVRRCLAKQANERPRDADELARLFEAALGQKITVTAVSETMTDLGITPAAPPPAPAPPPPAASPSSSNLFRGDAFGKITYHLEATLPTKIAVVKLRGYLLGLSQQCTEPQPGVFRVRLPRQAGADAEPKSGILVRLGKIKSPDAAPIFLEASVEKQEMLRPDKAMVTLVFQGSDGRKQLAIDPDGSAFCERTCSGICACLDAKVIAG